MGLESWGFRETNETSERKRDLDGWSREGLSELSTYDGLDDTRRFYVAETNSQIRKESSFIERIIPSFSTKIDTTEDTMLLATYLKELEQIQMDLVYNPTAVDDLIEKCERKLYKLLNNRVDKRPHISKPLDSFDELGPGGELGLITNDPQKKDDSPVETAPLLRERLRHSQAKIEQETEKESEKSIAPAVIADSEVDTKIVLTPEESETALIVLAEKLVKQKREDARRAKKINTTSPRKKTITRKRSVSILSEEEKSEIRQMIEKRLERREKNKSLTKRR